MPGTPLQPVHYESQISHRVANDFQHHDLNEEQLVRLGNLGAQFRSMAETVVYRTPASREQSLALTALEEASFWASAAIARNEKPE